MKLKLLSIKLLSNKLLRMNRNIIPSILIEQLSKKKANLIS